MRDVFSLALVALYQSTDGDNWLYNSNWLTESVNKWYGVTVNDNRVIRLHLYGNLLEGVIPNEISALSRLDHQHQGLPPGLLCLLQGLRQPPNFAAFVASPAPYISWAFVWGNIPFPHSLLQLPRLSQHLAYRYSSLASSRIQPCSNSTCQEECPL